METLGTLHHAPLGFDTCRPNCKRQFSCSNIASMDLLKVIRSSEVSALTALVAAIGTVLTTTGETNSSDTLVSARAEAKATNDAFIDPVTWPRLRSV